MAAILSYGKPQHQIVMLYKSSLFCLLLFSEPCFSQVQTDELLPGYGIKVTPLQSWLPEETFQSLIVVEGLRALGYQINDIINADYHQAYHFIANGEATFMADNWYPQHQKLYEQAGGDNKLFRQGYLVKDIIQGYLIDKTTADKYQITSLGQLRAPEVAKLFDVDNDGKADLIGCRLDWICNKIIDHQLKAYGLSDTVQQVVGNYTSLIEDTIIRYRSGLPILYYNWEPSWVSDLLSPGREVIWLQVPFTALPEGMDDETQLPSGINYGFAVNSIRIVANRKFAEQNPAAARLFSIMSIEVYDIITQNMMLYLGGNSKEDIEREVQSWIRIHQKVFDQWIMEAKKAAR